MKQTEIKEAKIKKAEMKELNGAGIEAYAKSYWDMLANLGGLAVYGVIVGRESGFLLAFLVLQTFIVTGFHLLAARRTYGMEEEIEDIWKEFRYLRRESILPGNGKDIRLYRMDRWFPEAMRESIRKICALIDREENGYMAAGPAVTWEGRRPIPTDW